MLRKKAGDQLREKNGRMTGIGCEQFVASLRRGLAAQTPWSAAYRRFLPELSYGRHRGPAGPDARRAAVIALFYPFAGQWHLPLIVRPASLADHAGQVCLPGGGLDPGESPRQGALRELHEELGVDPAAVETLGVLPPIYVYASNFLVHPFVALTPDRPRFRPNTAEVAQLLELPWGHLGNGHNSCVEQIVRGRLAFRAPGVAFHGRHIWGATAMILGELSSLVDAAMLDA